MRGHKALIAAFMLSASATVALACAIDLPNQLLDNRGDTLKAPPANLFAYEIRRLINVPKDDLKPKEGQEYHFSERTKKFYTGKDAVKQALADGIAVGLSKEQAMLLSALEDAGDSNAILAEEDKLPADVRLYSAGAVDYRRGQIELAAQRWQAVLDLPEEKRQLRTTHAAYMLGKIATAEGDADKAERAFALTRDLVRAGMKDPEGLAVASYGEEARIHLRRAKKLLENGFVPDEAAAEYAKEIDAAITLYAEQVVRKSNSGFASLRIVAQNIIQNRSTLVAAAQVPNAQRIVVAFILARFYNDVPDPNDQATDNTDDAASVGPDFTTKDVIETLAEEGERHGEGWLADAQWLAALAYREEEFDLTKRLLEKTRGPLASWLNAKLAVRNGDINAATGYYADAVKAFPTADKENPLDEANRSLLVGEDGVLALARGEYAVALEYLFAAGNTYWRDTAYVAERVLTVDELKKFVDAKVPPTNGDGSKPWGVGNLRDLLARRLMREGRHQDAFPYFQSPETRQHAMDYASSLKAASDRWFSIGRAEAWYHAAALARDAGMEMMGSEEGPDYFLWGGSWAGGAWPQEEEQIDSPFVTDGEKQRFARTKIEPDERYHYRYIAADLAQRSSELLPPRSQAFAAVLCKATEWMLQTRENDRARELYQRYVKQGAIVPWATHFGWKCPDPDFDAAPKALRRQFVGQVRHFISVQRWAFFGAILVVGVLLGWLIWQKRRHKHRRASAWGRSEE
ncbi:MAG: hypothetical protein F8N36_14250 [Desulfovibrio sp.]|uniref:hypothetical protein n=1 Tax=Desulfovibrio sp. TaxID=885 RepID=UPI00135DACF0|nr:hypothetical protein [Desulfovibrio sp.]MTJ94000.1 hypothetical protein [Desulfovibrio sp.]